MILALLLAAAAAKPNLELCAIAQGKALEAVREAWIPGLDLRTDLPYRTLECGCDCIYDEAAKYSCMAEEAKQRQDAHAAQLAKEREAAKLMDAADAACGRAKKDDDSLKVTASGAAPSTYIAVTDQVELEPLACTHKNTEDLGAVSIAGESVRLSVKRCKKCGVLMGDWK